MIVCSRIAYHNGNRSINVEVWYDYQPREEATDFGPEISQVAVWYHDRNITRWVNIDEITNKLWNELD